MTGKGLTPYFGLHLLYRSLRGEVSEKLKSPGPGWRVTAPEKVGSSGGMGDTADLEALTIALRRVEERAHALAAAEGPLKPLAGLLADLADALLRRCETALPLLEADPDPEPLLEQQEPSTEQERADVERAVKASKGRTPPT